MAVVTEREREMMVTLDVSQRLKKALHSEAMLGLYCGVQDHLCIQTPK